MFSLDTNAPVPLWEPKTNERILILAPHPDDETLAAGGVIASAAEKAHLRVIIATNGDGSYLSALTYGQHSLQEKNFQRLAIMRQQESFSALVFLGLSAKEIRFWGFPDRGLNPIWENYWDELYPYHSPTTGFNKAEQTFGSPPLFYTGVNLISLLQREFRAFAPTTIIMPHPQDAHPDHRALARFTQLSVALSLAQEKIEAPKLLAYKIWDGKTVLFNGSKPKGPGAFSRGEKNTVLYLSIPPQIRKKKALALQCYRSQKLAAFQPLRKSAENAYEAFIPMKPYQLNETRPTI